jgi:putative transcriptional regulator
MRKKQRIGRRLVGDLTALRDTLRSGEAVERRFTVREVSGELDPRPFLAKDVRGLRDDLRLSQGVFAKVCGVSADLVQSWEQGVRKPGKMACRLLELVARDRGAVMDLMQSGRL